MRGDTASEASIRPDIAAAIKSAAFFGLTLELDLPEQVAGLWLEHLPAWQAWCEISGQWRTIALSTEAGARVVWVGLDYAAAKYGLEMAGISVTPACWAEVRLIEEGATEELNRNGR